MRIKYIDTDFRHSARVCVCVRVRIRTRTHTHAHQARKLTSKRSLQTSVPDVCLSAFSRNACLLGVRARTDLNGRSAMVYGGCLR